MCKVQNSPKVLCLSLGHIRRQGLVVPVAFPFLAMLVGRLVAKRQFLMTVSARSLIERFRELPTLSSTLRNFLIKNLTTVLDILVRDPFEGIQKLDW